MYLKDKRRVYKWEIGGIFFLIIVGSLVHFAYDLSNQSLVVGLFAPVNESVWEHMKLGFTALVLFSLIEYRFVRKSINNFLLAKGLGLLILQATILTIFYSYTFFTEHPILLIDISSFVIGCILCQAVSYRILTRTAPNRTLNYLGLSFILIHAGLLVFFTFYPPEMALFQEYD